MNGDGANRVTAPYHWDGDGTPEANGAGNVTELILGILQHIRDHDRSLGQNCPGCRTRAVRSPWPALCDDVGGFRVGVREGGKMNELAIERGHESMLALA